jgi:hypothetical protein
MRDRRVALWVVMGVVLGMVVAPHVAGAVGSLVTIQGGNGSAKASVTDGKQLQVAEAAPSSFREFSFATDDGGCHTFATAPANKGFVIRSISLDVITPSTAGIEGASLFANGNCVSQDIYSVSTHVRGTHPESLDPGFAIAPGGQVSIKAFTSGMIVDAFVWGYFVPANDVPATTPIN